MKTLKRLLVITATVILFCVISVAASAETYGNLSYTVSNGEVTITGCNYSELKIDIPAEINGYPVTTIGDCAFLGFENLTSVTIPDSVTTIEANAFSFCCNLTSVTIPDSVTTIGAQAFYDCGLTDVTIPDSVTSIGCDAFFNNPFYKNSANWENGVFYINNHLIAADTNITGNYEIKQGTLTIGDAAFYSCNGLTGVTIPDSVTTIGAEAFSFCFNLASVTIPDSVTTIGSRAFCCCNLTNITIPYSVITIGGEAFLDNPFYSNPTNWENGVLSINNHLIAADANITGDYEIKQGTLTIGDAAFYNCYGLTSVIIPDSVTTISASAFASSGITSVTIPDSVTTIDSRAFANCKSLESITIPDSVKTINDEVFCGCDSLANVTIGKSVTKIGDKAFYLCDNLTKITIPENVTKIGAWAFFDCDGLMSITINNPECLIHDADYTIDSMVVIYGHCGSTAHAYAKEYDRTFVPFGHTEEVVPAKAATCSEKGLTEGKKCSRCGEIIVAQQEIPTLNHTFGEWMVVNAPTVSAEGKEERACSACGEKETRAIAKLNFMLGDVNGDNQITAEDARLALRLSAGLETLEELKVSVEVVDYNKDKQITAEDARRILRKSAGLE